MPVQLVTERLVLAPHTLKDFEPMAAMWADADVVRHIAAPSSRRESWMRLLRYRGLWPLLGFGYWAVRERASGRFVGDVGFADFCRDVDPPINGLPEAGWVMAAWAHGRGYAGEAVAAALAWLDGRSAPRSVCLIAPGNEASLRLAGRQGYGAAQTVQFMGETTLLLTRQRASSMGRTAALRG